MHISDTEAVDRVITAAKKVLGPDSVHIRSNPSMGSEDFSVLHPAYGPGCQFNIGTANDDPRTRLGIHNPENVFDERCLPYGTAVLVQFARDFLV